MYPTILFLYYYYSLGHLCQASIVFGSVKYSSVAPLVDFHLIATKLNINDCFNGRSAA